MMLNESLNSIKLEIFEHVQRIYELIRRGRCDDGEECSYFSPDEEGRFGSCKKEECLLSGIFERSLGLKFDGKKLFYKGLSLLLLPELEEVEIISIAPRPYAHDKGEGWTREEIEVIERIYTGRILELEKSFLIQAILNSEDGFHIIWDFSKDPMVKEEVRRVFGSQSAVGMSLKYKDNDLGITLGFFDKEVLEKQILKETSVGKEEKEELLKEIFDFLIYACTSATHIYFDAQRKLEQKETMSIVDVSHMIGNLLAALNPLVKDLWRAKDEEKRNEAFEKLQREFKHTEERLELFLVLDRVKYEDIIEDFKFQVSSDEANENLGKIAMESFWRTFYGKLFEPKGVHANRYEDARERLLEEDFVFQEGSRLLEEMGRGQEIFEFKGNGLKEGVAFNFKIKDAFDLKWKDEGSYLRQILSILFEEIYSNALKECPYPKDISKRYINTCIVGTPSFIDIKVENNYEPIEGEKPGRGKDLIRKLAKKLGSDRCEFVPDPENNKFICHIVIKNFIEEKRKRENAEEI